MANNVLGMPRLKNKVNRNAFALSHRHMFTAQVGELLSMRLHIVTGKQIGRASCRERV